MAVRPTDEANVHKLATLGFFETCIMKEELDYAYIGNYLIHYKSKAKLIGYIQFAFEYKRRNKMPDFGELESDETF